VRAERGKSRIEIYQIKNSRETRRPILPDENQIFKFIDSNSPWRENEPNDRRGIVRFVELAAASAAVESAGWPIEPGQG
jgi:hypothetical protein